jgi:hypothetical protein
MLSSVLSSLFMPPTGPEPFTQMSTIPVSGAVPLIAIKHASAHELLTHMINRNNVFSPVQVTLSETQDDDIDW